MAVRSPVAMSISSMSRSSGTGRICGNPSRRAIPRERIWTYIGYGPFADHAAFLAWLKEPAGPRPVVLRLRAADTGKAAGMASFMRMTPERGDRDRPYLDVAGSAEDARGDGGDLPDDAPCFRRTWAAGGSNGNAMPQCAVARRRQALRLHLRGRFSASISSSRAATATRPGFRSSTRNGRRSTRVPGLAEGRQFRRARRQKQSVAGVRKPGGIIARADAPPRFERIQTCRSTGDGEGASPSLRASRSRSETCRASRANSMPSCTGSSN